ncbi:BamA/TamA family outer membrane protein [Spirosoma foliorum]|uniref:BamA/TamA family outer membrane protein n=1 Tax=Spirosoma foliorum TaxID=2710596 RepID=A0A7G5H469_9BACT|nr:BamA/TamA family outer membrane protein [Spirosoma foliorum]QMW05911.1 BamA/TamA family outer membrane protein [Spirosoma foliorum]
MRYYLGWVGLLFLPILGLGRSMSHPPGVAMPLADTAKEAHHRFQLIPLPVIFYTPETKIAYGLLGVCLFKTDSTARTSNVDFAIIHTQNAQTVIEPTYTIFTKGEKYLIRGMLLFTKFPELYYGIGPGTTDDEEELISYKSLRAYNRFLRRVKPGWFVGVQQQYFKTFDISRSSDRQLPAQTLIGSLGSVVNGLGVASLVDTRDNIYSPVRGWYADVSFMEYGKLLGSEFGFTNFLFDIRHYRSLTPNTVLAGQFYLNLNLGEVPFKQAATLGGSSLLRGYYNGRYRDNNAVIMQAELRQHLFGRIGGVVFAGVGDVAHKPSEFEVGDLKPTGGAGLRYLISRKEHLNVRFDAAVGNHTHGFYVNISEAF